MSADNNKPADEEKAEPRENDKCMDDGSARNHRDRNPKGMSKLRAQVTSAVSNIPSLVIVLLCVLLFVFFVIIIVLAVQINQAQPSDVRKQCYSAECLDVASQVIHSLNQSTAPCDNFYTYSCGGFVSQHQLGRRSKVDVSDVVEKSISHTVRHAVDLVADNARETLPESKVRRFYQTCMEPRGLTDAARSLFVYTIRKVGGWSIIRESSWSLQSWDKDLALEMLIVSYGVHPFFRVGVTPDVNRDANTNAIRLDPAGFMFESYEYYADGAPKQYRDLLSAYKDFIEKVVEGMRDIPASHTVSVTADNIINYERRLLERLKAPNNDTVLYERTTIGGLQQRVPLVKWLKLFQAYFPGARIATETPVYVSHPHYFAQLGPLISSTDDITLNNYLMWRMVMKYAPHLDKRTRTLYSKFMQTLRGAADADLPEEDWWEQCVRYTSHYLGYAVGALYVEAFKDKENVIEKAKEIAAKVKTASKNSVENVQWIHDKQPVKEKLEGVDIEVGYPDILTNSDRLEAYYQDLIVRLGSHLENVFEAEKFLRMKQAEQLTERGAGSPDHVWTTHPQDARAQYLYEQNRLLVPLAVLQKPVFSLDQLSSLQYGSLGSLVGTHMFKALDKKGIDVGPIRMFADNSTRRRYTEKLECLADGYPDATKDGQKIDGSRTSGEAFADVAGVRSAYQAFKDNNGDGKEGLPALDMSPEQLFFIGYAQSMCENIRDERVINANASSQSAPNRLRLLVTVQQLPEFANAFGCSSDTTVKAAKNCDSW